MFSSRRMACASDSSAAAELAAAASSLSRPKCGRWYASASVAYVPACP